MNPIHRSSVHSDYTENVLIPIRIGDDDGYLSLPSGSEGGGAGCESAFVPYIHPSASTCRRDLASAQLQVGSTVTRTHSVMIHHPSSGVLWGRRSTEYRHVYEYIHQIIALQSIPLVAGRAQRTSLPPMLTYVHPQANVSIMASFCQSDEVKSLSINMIPQCLIYLSTQCSLPATTTTAWNSSSTACEFAVTAVDYTIVWSGKVMSLEWWQCSQDHGC